MHTHPANPVVYVPPCAAVCGPWNTLLSVEVHSVAAPVVMSRSLVCFFFMNVPIALNETGEPVATGLGPLLRMVVLVADGRGVNVGVIVLCLGVGVNVAVGEGGAPVEITIALSAKPGVALAVAVPLLLPPPQLNRIAPKTNNRTGVTTSHLSHRDNMKSSPMTDARERCQGDARFRRANAAAKLVRIH
jgi:hypothetical protein